MVVSVLNKGEMECTARQSLEYLNLYDVEYIFE